MDLLIHRPRWAALWLAAVALCPACAGLSPDSANEYEVKAAFLYKFSSFVEWPEISAVSDAGPEHQPASRKCIGILGEDPFGSVLDEVTGGRVAVRRSLAGQDPTECRVVFVSASEKKRMAAILDVLRQAAILTVADTPGFCELGGMVNLQLDNKRVSLEINPDAALRARLRFSSRLLGVARIVRQPASNKR